MGVDAAIKYRDGEEERVLDVEKGEVNGEEVREKVEGLRRVEGYRAVVEGVAFLVGVVGIWGDGA